MALPVKIESCLGVLESWNVGVLEEAEVRISI